MKQSGSLLRNELIILEPANEENVDLLIKWRLDPIAQGAYKRVPDMSAPELRELFLTKEERRYFLIKRSRDAKPLDRFYYRAWHFNPDPQKIDWELNLFIADEADRGQGYGSAAQILAASFLELLEETHSVFAYTMTANRAEQKALEKAEFKFAGRLPSPYYKVLTPPEEYVLYNRS